MEISYKKRYLIMSLFPVRLIQRVRMRFQLRLGKVPLLVFQPGKVASSSIYDGIRLSSLGKSHPVYHIHYITDHGLAYKTKFYRDRKTYLRNHLVVGGILNSYFKRKNNAQSYIVSAVRHPLEREISGFFENLTQLYPGLARFTGQEFACKALETLACHLSENAKAICDELDGWFERELASFSGLDVFRYPYNKSKGYQYLENDHHKMVLYRIEDLSSKFSEGMKALTGYPIELGVRNVGSKKYYSSAYRYARKNLQLSPDIIDIYNSSKVAQHFYGNELKSFQDRWSIRP